MLNSCMRKATAAQRPVNTSGVAATIVLLTLSWPTKAASKRRWNVGPGAWCVASRISVITPAATTSEPTGTTIVSHHGCVRRRSTRITSGGLSAGHQQAEILDGRRLGVALADDAALVEHGDAVGQREDLVEVLRDEQHGDPT